MIGVDEAIRQILQEVSPTGMERVPLSSVLGRVLAEDITARREHPPWNNSAMDGYAVRWEDIRGAAPDAPILLQVVGEVQAGRLPDVPVGMGEAVQIMTGAPMPEGANAVIRVEDTERLGDRVKILTACRKNDHIRFQGEDIHRGDPVIFRGTWGRPAEVGMLATAGYTSALVYRRPLVTVLATGDELAEPGEGLTPEKIINSNSYSISSLVEESGGIPVTLETARDTRSDLEGKVREALSADMVLVIGGVSMGKYDYVRDVLQDLGCEMKFWRVSMRPGHPIAFGVLPRGGAIAGSQSRRLFFGLPGNPVSCMVTFYQFVRPALRKMMGGRELFLPVVDATLKDDIRTRPGRRQFVRAITSWEDGAYMTRLTGDQGSGILLSMVQANSLMILPEERGEFRAGERVSVQLLPSR